MDIQSKIAAFEYVLYKLDEWYKEINGEKENDLGILKVMKLLFFVSGVEPANNLFDIFNRFQAWHYGHMEADLYNQYSQMNGDFNYLELSTVRSIFKENDSTREISKKLKSRIDDNIYKLKEKNKDLINYDSNQLISLSRSHHSWDIYYRRLDKPYTDMDIQTLINEPKYYK